MAAADGAAAARCVLQGTRGGQKPCNCCPVAIHGIDAYEMQLLTALLSQVLPLFKVLPLALLVSYLTLAISDSVAGQASCSEWCRVEDGLPATSDQPTDSQRQRCFGDCGGCPPVAPAGAM